MTYKVKRKRIVTARHETLQGKCDNGKLCISIATKLHEQRQRETFMHEIIHAISCDRRLDLEEHKVDQIAAGLVDVLLRNQDVTRLYIHD